MYPKKKHQQSNRHHGETHDIYQPHTTIRQQPTHSQNNISSKSSFSCNDDEQDKKQSRILNKSQNIQKVLNRLGLQTKTKQGKKNQQLQVLIGNIVQNCVGTIDHQNNLKQYEKIYSEQYKQQCKNYKSDSSIIVSQLTELEQILLIKQYGFMAIFKEIRLFLKRISLISNAIVEHNLFETVILLVIVLNSIKMALDDPLSDQESNPVIENIFIALYVIEMALKIMAYGFLFNQKAYLRDPWNILDFIIVVTSLLPIFINIGFSVNSLRAIRVLRPLKTITKIKALKMIVSTLFFSFSLVIDSLSILFFVMIVFSIAGTQLFSGVLKNRCIQLATGTIIDQMCVHGEVCSQGYLCGKGIQSPNFSITNFDTVLWSMLTVFQTFTLQGWSDIMIDLQIAYSPVSVIYSLLIVFFCEYVLLNMTMAILKYKYSQVKGNTIEQQQQQQTQYQPQFLKKLGIFKSITNLSPQPPLQRYQAKDKIFVGSIQFHTQQQQYPLCNQFMQDIVGLQTDNIRKTGYSRRNSQNSQSKKVDLNKLPINGKIQQLKWDIKALHFQSIDPLMNRDHIGSHESVKSLQNVDNNLAQRQLDKQEAENNKKQSKPISIASLQYDDQLSDQSDVVNKNQYDIDEKAYQMQIRMGMSRKYIQNQQVNSPRQQQNQQKLDVSHKKQMAYQANLKNKQMLRHYKRNEIKQFNDTLQLVRDASDRRIYEIDRNIILPQIDFNQYKTDLLFERFGDLGEYGLKRFQKKNQIDFFTIKEKKSKVIVEKKGQNIAQDIVEEASLDIQQLQLVNELNKKKMKCRISKRQSQSSESNYDASRVLILKNMLQQQNKQKQIEQNMHNLNFRVSYRQSQSVGMSSLGKSVFMRSLQSEYLGLKIPQIYLSKQKKQKLEHEQRSCYISRTANYIRMLQKHKMDEKIEMDEDKIMAVFFKKQKQPKTNTNATDVDTTNNSNSAHTNSKLNSNTTKNSTHPKQTLTQQYTTIKQSDIFNRHGSIVMSQPFHLQNPHFQSLADSFFDNINIKDEEYQIYMRGILGIINVIRKKTLLFITRPFYDNFMLLLVIANTLTLSLNGIVDTSQQQFVTLNLAFTIAFTVDLTLKIFAYGFDFFGDVMNIFDSFVVSISIVELSLGTGSTNLTALRSIRILRAFRVLRITRLIRSLNYMKIVMSVVSSVITEFVYIFMLLALFIFIYTLLGMQIFGNQLLPQSITNIRQNFDSFFNAVFSVFQILTVENWNDISLAVMTSPIGYVSVFYFISWIFIGNWILLNLLQAILLDGFDKDSSPQSPDEQDQNDEGEEEEEEVKIQQQKQQSKTNIQSLQDNLEQTRQDNISLLLFYPDSGVRVLATNISKSQIFQNFIIIAIALSSIKLVIDTYLPKSGEAAQISDIIDIVFNCIFITECLLKIISRGFFFGKNTYLSDSWCQLDFFIVATAIIDMSLAGAIDLSILKLFRTLRPLRIVSRNPEMKVIISSLAQSMLGIFNVIIIILCVFLMFGILGINLLQNKLSFCNYSAQLTHGQFGPYGVTQANCQEVGGVWTKQFINFDNILESLLSLYVFSTRQNWPYYVYTFIDSGEEAPTRDANQILYMVISFVIIFVCSYFFMDLLVGVLFMNFHEAEQKIRPKKLTDKQINWKNLQKIILEEDPCFELYLKPENPFRAFFHRIVTCKPFQLFITLCILGNIVVMTVGTDDQTNQTEETLKTVNFVFSVIFICEMVFKLFSFAKAYFLSGWNIFDFFVVMASILDIILDFTGSNSAQSSTLTILPQIARIFRVLRVTRLLRMFKRFKGLQKLIQTFIFSLPSLARGLSIVGLFLFISSNVGTDYAGNIDQHRNFSNFHSSLQTLFIITTGENWYFYMYQTTNVGYIQCKDIDKQCVSMAYLIFWLIYVFFSQKVFMELFVLIVLDQFESNYVKQNNPLGIFSLFQDDFRTNWIQNTGKYHSQKIQTKKLLDLLLVLKQPLGLGKRQLLKQYEEELRENQKITNQEIQSNIRQLDIKLKKNGAKLIQKMDIIKNRIYLGYHQTFYRFAKLTFSAEVNNNSTLQQKQLLQQIHKQSQEKLLELMPQGNNFEFQQNQYESQQPLNPIELILFSQMIVKSWHNYSLKFFSQSRQSKQNNKDNINQNYSLNNSCSSEIVQAQLQRMPLQKRKYKRTGFIEGLHNQQIEYKMMPNIDDHYQNERKKNKKGISQQKKNESILNKINMEREYSYHDNDNEDRSG